MDITIPPGSVAGALTPPCSKSYAQRALAASLLMMLGPSVLASRISPATIMRYE